MTSDGAARAELTGLCHQVSRRGLIGPLASGNASLRVGSHLLVTPSAVSFADTVAEELVLMDFASGEPAPATPRPGRALRPTSELALHLAVHEAAAPEMRCCLHLHAPWTVAASCLDLTELPLLHYHQALLGDSATPVVPYATPGSPELAANVAAAVGPAMRAVVMANHGAVVLGPDCDGALALAEVLEDACRLTVLTRGAARELAQSALGDARGLFDSYGS